MDFLKKLNQAQHKAVTAGDGAVLVLAGPGSGKTRVLTHRIAYLIQGLGVPPYAILAVTFTNRAAREMQQRVEGMLGTDVREIWLGTFHAMCARILRREYAVTPYDRNFVIMDSDDQEKLVKRAIDNLRIDPKLFKPASMHAAISSLKNQMLWPDDFKPRGYREEIIQRIYTQYNQLLIANNALDFDDLLLWAVRILEKNPEIRQRYASRFQHVLVDEFQDTNAVQYRFLQLISSHHRNIFVVGDEDQSIYRWRGADYHNVLAFEEDFSGEHKILLEQNYRSMQIILDAARAVIDRNTQRTPKALFTERGGGEKITLYEASNDYAEADYVVATIQQALARGVPGSQFAVMYRTNAQSRLLEEGFLRAGLPYKLVGAQRFYGRREVKDVIAFLRLAQNPADEISLARAIGVPPRGIGEKTLLTLQILASNAGLSAGQVLMDLGRQGKASPFWEEFRGRPAALLADFGALMAAWNNAARSLSVAELFDQILRDIGYEAYIKDESEEGDERWENVQELRRLAFEYDDRELTDFLENMALVSDQDTLGAEAVNAPTLLTLHAAKGLEFDQVFITGLDEGLLPHSRSKDDPEEMAEERRLFYVGITRARNRLYLARAEQRSGYNTADYSTASRFLDDIPEELLKREGVRSSYGRQSRREVSYPSWGRDRPAAPPPSARKPVEWPTSARQPAAPRPPDPEPESRPATRPVKQRYHPSQRVRHPVWGEGMVMNSKVEDNEEIVDVFFGAAGLKRLLASLANLEDVSGDQEKTL